MPVKLLKRRRRCWCKFIPRGRAKRRHWRRRKRWWSSWAVMGQRAAAKVALPYFDEIHHSQAPARFPLKTCSTMNNHSMYKIEALLSLHILIHLYPLLRFDWIYACERWEHGSHILYSAKQSFVVQLVHSCSYYMELESGAVMVLYNNQINGFILSTSTGEGD